MLEILKKLRAIITAREIRRFAGLLIAFMVMGIFEVVGIASIVPFMQLVAQPDAIEQNEWLRWAYEQLGFQNERAFLIAVGVGVLVLLAATNTITVLTTWLQYKFVWSTAHALAVRVLKAYIYQPYKFFLRNNSSDLGKQVLAEVQKLANSVLLPLVQLVARSFVVAIIFSLLIAVNLQLSIMIFVVFGSAYAVIYFSVRRYLARLGKERFEANRMRFRTVNEALGSIKVVKIRGCEAFFVNRFSAASKRVNDVLPKAQVISAVPIYFIQTLAFGGLLTIVLYLLAAEKSMQNVIPILSLYALAGYRLLPSLQQIFKAISSLPYNVPVIDTIHRDLAMATSEGSGKPSGNLVFEEEITIHNLTFKYQGLEEPVLHNINLRIPKDKSVAIVGPTGSGKTTLVDVIMGLLQPQSGRVMVDGVSITPDNVRQWQAIAGYVPQEVTLYDDTLTRNIAFGVDDQEVDLARVQQAAKTANVHSFILDELQDGYDTIVGERGVRLSGGQRQRIGLARAFYHYPKVLILDEATSALDGITEEAVMQEIAQIEYKMTTITIAHRLATVRDCDRIYLLDRGRIVAEGTYDDLIEQSSMFRGMAKVAS